MGKLGDIQLFNLLQMSYTIQLNNRWYDCGYFQHVIVVCSFFHLQLKDLFQVRGTKQQNISFFFH